MALGLITDADPEQLIRCLNNSQS